MFYQLLEGIFILKISKLEKWQNQKLMLCHSEIVEFE